MSWLAARAAREACGTSSRRSLLRGAIASCIARGIDADAVAPHPSSRWETAFPSSLWRQDRGAKRANRRVDVVLLQDVEGLGREGAVVNVKPGRARNHLVPHKMASYPNEHRLAEAAAKRETWDEAVVKEASEDAAAKENKIALGILVNTPLVVKRIEDKTTKQPRLPVTAELLQKEALRQRQLECDVRMFVMPKDGAALKTFGEHKVPLWIDKRQVPEEQTLTVIVRKKR
mmetsp:Transcript_11169/g.44970  ORF Transcript_11169/g.44970 Transcript_11169/m.44970 type:complete len:231 (+) Transcript_11169:65-757(+)